MIMDQIMSVPVCADGIDHCHGIMKIFDNRSEVSPERLEYVSTTYHMVPSSSLLNRRYTLGSL